MVSELKQCRLEFGKALTDKSVKQRWRAVNDIIKPFKTPKAISLIELNAINETFAAVFEPIGNNYPLQQQSHQESYNNDFQTNEHEVFFELNHIKSNAAGPDGIPGLIYKKYATLFAQPLTLLFNRIFKTCCIPLIWKKAHIILIPKQGGEFIKPYLDELRSKAILAAKEALQCCFQLPPPKDDIIMRLS